MCPKISTKIKNRYIWRLEMVLLFTSKIVFIQNSECQPKLNVKEILGFINVNQKGLKCFEVDISSQLIEDWEFLSRSTHSKTRIWSRLQPKIFRYCMIFGVLASAEKDIWTIYWRAKRMCVSQNCSSRICKFLSN